MKARHIMLIFACVLLTACRSSGESAGVGPDLRFEAPAALSAEGEWRASLGVRNAGTADFPADDGFYAVMDLQAQDGRPRARMELYAIDTIPAGETVWPIGWRGVLDPGNYELIWGAAGHGYTRVTFSVFERDGRSDMTDLVEEGFPDAELPAATITVELYGLVDQAKRELASTYGLALDDVVFRGVQWVRFTDPGLELPAPGAGDAQVTTPGYIIDLEAAGRTYSYHAAGNRLVPADPGADTSGR